MSYRVCLYEFSVPVDLLYCDAVQCVCVCVCGVYVMCGVCVVNCTNSAPPPNQIKWEGPFWPWIWGGFGMYLEQIKWTI